MDEIFQAVYQFLKWASETSGLSYHEVNIIVYYIIIPAFFVFLLGRILKRKALIIGFLTLVLLLIIIIPDFRQFSTNLFNKSTDFLNWFEHFGLNYVQASVVVCVITPILIVLLLIYLNKRNRLNKNPFQK